MAKLTIFGCSINSSSSPPPGGAFYVMDKVYLDFARLYRLHQPASGGAFFVTRAKRNIDFCIRQLRPVTPDGPVTSDRLVRQRGAKSCTLYPDALRLIRYVDPHTGRRLRFLTNHLTLDAPILALLIPPPLADRDVLRVDQAAPHAGSGIECTICTMLLFTLN